MENRRSFVAKTGLGLAAGYLNLNPAAKGANERVTLGLIGGRNQGRNVALRAIENGAVIKTFCDLDEAIIRKVSPDFEKAQHRAPAPAKDFRTLLDDKELDGVIIAVPDHWHTHIGLLACQAGKDIYIEKPLSQTIREGQMLRDAARKYNRLAQVGTQRRSGEHFREAVEYATSGKLGKICQIRAWCYQLRETIGNPPDGAPPATVDYDVWLGPARERPFNPNRFHYKWRFFWDYGNSELGNMGVHVLDVAMRGIQNLRGVKNCLPRRIYSSDGIYWLKDAKEVPDTQVVTFDYGDMMLTWELRSFAEHYSEHQDVKFGTAFHGSEGSVIISCDGWKVTSPKGKVIESNPSDSEETLLKAHLKNFVECVKSRKTPNGDIELGRLSTTMTHLGNISHHLKRPVDFNGETETFGDDQAANGYLTKEYRAKYPLPKV